MQDRSNDAKHEDENNGDKIGLGFSVRNDDDDDDDDDVGDDDDDDVDDIDDD